MPDYKMRTAKPADMARLHALWIDCFGDTAEYADYVFAGLIKPDRALICGASESRATPVDSMLFFEPFTLGNAEQSFRGAYIYGVATDTARRGEGLSTKLLEYAHSYLAENGFELSILVPASESLFEFYGKRGYSVFSDICRARIKGADISSARDDVRVSPAKLEDLAAIREKFFGGAGFVGWNSEYLRYNGGECEHFGGGVLRIDYNSASGYAVCGRADNLVHVKELAVPSEFAVPAMEAIHAKFGADEYILSLRADYKPDFAHSVLPYSMIKWYDNGKSNLHDSTAYIAFTLD